MKKLNELQKLELLGLMVGVGLALLALIPFFVFDQLGWLIGVGIGTAIELLNILILYKGSESVLRHFKTTRFLLAYFTRLTLFLLGFVIAIIFDLGIVGLPPLACFHNAIWGVFIAYTPLQIVIVVIMGKTKTNVVSIAKNLEGEE